MKKLSNCETELKKVLAIKKIVYFYTTFTLGSHCAINDNIWRYFFDGNVQAQVGTLLSSDTAKYC